MQTQRIALKCPKCGKELKFPERAKGKTGMCPSCSTTFLISSDELSSPKGTTTRVSKKIILQYPAPLSQTPEPQPPTRKLPDPWTHEHAATTHIEQPAQKNKPESQEEFHITTYVKKRKKS
ncbi:MAG: hypothetical protein HZA48_12265 [Planctomycetes bacterium]|nr:hypothetical protein [Planctomycetota bacterium]